MSVRRWLVRPLLYLVTVAATVLATIVLVYAVQARVRLPELHAWHKIVLREEAGRNHPEAFESFDAYRQQEDRLFAELRERIYAPAEADTFVLGRYNPQSVVAKLALDTPYNRSYELVPAGEPRGSVLLMHGLSDSPYAMRGIGEVFQRQGFYVVALRLPGHGTVPSGLRDVRWEDWYAAVAAAAKYTAGRGGSGKPFYIGGFSTGAALATLYSVRSLDDSALPKPQGLYLVSPAIGISPFAVLTNVISGLAFIPAFEKSRWIDVFPEYDPYKYNSFPVNAGNQIHTLTGVLRDALDDAGQRGRLEAMPRIVAFQSIVDSTITAREVARGLLRLLPRADHELVVFDVNRIDAVQGLIAPGPLEDLEAMRDATDLPFRLTLIGSSGPDTRAVAAYTREAGAAEVQKAELGLEWPPAVFSLGHVALPFPPDDPVYGITLPPGPRPPFNLGAVAVRGESGALVLSLGSFSRLRSNPFFDVVRAKILETLARDEQTLATTGTEHFEGWLSDAHWGADKQTFDVRFGIRRVEATFTVAKNGFGWQQTFTGVKETFNSWDAVAAWCFAPGTLLFRTPQDPGHRLGVYELKPEDLVSIVDGYFKRYAPQAEWSGPEWECTPAGLSGPNPTALSRVRELLEAASSEKL